MRRTIYAPKSSGWLVVVKTTKYRKGNAQAVSFNRYVAAQKAAKVSPKTAILGEVKLEGVTF